MLRTWHQPPSARPVGLWDTGWARMGSVTPRWQHYFPSTGRDRAEMGRRVQTKPDLGDLGPLWTALQAAPGPGPEHYGGGGVFCLQRILKPRSDLGAGCKEGEGLASCTLQDPALETGKGLSRVTSLGRPSFSSLPFFSLLNRGQRDR